MDPFQTLHTFSSFDGDNIIFDRITTLNVDIFGSFLQYRVWSLCNQLFFTVYIGSF